MKYLERLRNAFMPSRHRARWAAVPVVAAAMALAHAQPPAPAHWVAYAQLAGNALQSRLSDGPGELVTRLHAWLERRQTGEAAPVSVIVRIWISADGRVERSEFDSLGDSQADADLRALLTARPLPEPPPPEMRQPLVLRLTLRSNPGFDPASVTGATRPPGRAP